MCFLTFLYFSKVLCKVYNTLLSTCMVFRNNTIYVVTNPSFRWLLLFCFCCLFFLCYTYQFLLVVCSTDAIQSFYNAIFLKMKINREFFELHADYYFHTPHNKFFSRAYICENNGITIKKNTILYDEGF